MNVIKKINIVLDEGFEEGDMVKVIGNVAGKGSIGKVIDISPQGSFYIVKIGNKTHSYHESDIQLKKKVNEEGESGATVVANVEKNPAAATNMVRRTPPELTHPECGKGQRWCTIKKACIPDPRVAESNAGIKSDIEFVRQVAKDQGVDDFISDAEAKRIIRDVKRRGSKEDFYYNLKEYFYA